MTQARAAVAVVALLLVRVPLAAQQPDPVPDEQVPPPAAQEPSNPNNPDAPANPRRPVWDIVKDVGRDFTNLPSIDNLRLLLVGGALAGAAHYEDRYVNQHIAGDHWVHEVFKPGKVIGYGLIQAAAAGAAYTWGREEKQPKVVHIGVDLLRAQLVTGALTYGLKSAIHRDRPDGSGSHSFPSGHASVTFATATVLARHFGWKGMLAYSASSYVAASRIHDHRHYLSDVVFGAAVGTIAGRTVTRHARDKWTVELLPVDDGVLLAFARVGG